MNAREFPRILSLLAVSALLSACGGSDREHAVAHLPTPSITYLQDAGLVVGAPTPPLRPDIAGSVTGDFAISPALPPGLTIDPDLGSIYGIPTAPAPTTSYTVTAASSDGPIKTTVTFTVRDVIPNVSYSPASRNLTQDVPLPENITPSNRGGVVVSWSIDRALPAGLAFDTASGAISGTPTAASPQTNYEVTATNSGGISVATLTLTVQAASGLGGMTIRSRARPEATQSVGVAGNSSVVQSGDWLMVFRGGAPLSNIEIPAATRWWLLAADGSYVVAATDAKLIAWSPAGVVLFTKLADYSHANAFAAARELRVAVGPAGQQVIESIALPTGDARVSAMFTGTFLSWSADGDRFVAGTDDAMVTYPHDAGRVAAAGLTTAGAD